MFYIVYKCICANSASGNRFLSFLKGFDELGVEGTVVLLSPSVDHYRIKDSFHHLRVRYFWNDWPFCRKVFDRIRGSFSLWQLKAMLKGGDVVFCYGSQEFLAELVRIKDVKVYHERTESPVVLPLRTQKQQKRYLRACTELEGLFVISTALRKFFVEHGVAKEKTHIVNMMVDCCRFADINKGMPEEKYIAYCGRASNNKDGVDELIKAFSIVASQHSDVKLYIIGETPSSDDKAGNLKLIKDLGLSEKVVFTGVVDASQMPQILMDATVLALDRPDSLQAQNGFPTKLGEYLLTSNPVVVTKVGDIPLFLKDGESALLAEQRNPEEFASKLCWALDNPEDAAAIGRKGKEVAMKNFNYLNETAKIVKCIFNQ